VETGQHPQWYYGDNDPAWHVIETPSRASEKPRELSLFASEKYRTDAARMRRYSLRIDGFVSVEAPRGWGVSHRTPGVRRRRVRPELRDVRGGDRRGRTPGTGRDDPRRVLAGESPELLGDDLERVVTWSGGRSVGELAGDPVRGGSCCPTPTSTRCSSGKRSSRRLAATGSARAYAGGSRVCFDMDLYSLYFIKINILQYR